MQKFLAAVFVLLIHSSIARADSGAIGEEVCANTNEVVREADKAQCVKTWLKTYHRELRIKYLNQQQQKFCTKFHQALASASSSIKYVEPVARSDDREHPLLKPYNDCAHYRGPARESPYPGISPDAHDLRLYCLSRNGKSGNDPEMYLYEEETYGAPRTGSGETRYVRVDLTTCEEIDLLNVSAVKPKRTEARSGARVNALIRYQAQFYIYNLDGGLALELYKFEAKTGYFVQNPSCWWKGIDAAKK
jgi:hypothetical protein